MTKIKKPAPVSARTQQIKDRVAARKAEGIAGGISEATMKAPEPRKVDFAQWGQAIVLSNLAEDLGMHVIDVVESLLKHCEAAGLPAKPDRWVIDAAHKLNRNAIDASLFRNNRPLTQKAPELSWTEAKAEVETPAGKAVGTREKVPGKVRHAIFGHPATRVVMWMGKNGIGAIEAAKVLEHFNVASTPASIATFIRSGIKGDRGDVASLTEAEAATIRKILK